MVLPKSVESEPPHTSLSLDEGPGPRLDPSLAWAIAWSTKRSFGRCLNGGYEVIEFVVNRSLAGQSVAGQERVREVNEGLVL